MPIASSDRRSVLANILYQARMIGLQEGEGEIEKRNRKNGPHRVRDKLELLGPWQVQ